MYEAALALCASPFTAEPRQDLYVPLVAAEKARAQLGLAIARGQGIAVLFGAPGLGKTMLARQFCEDLRSEFLCLLVGGGRLTSRKALFQTLLYEAQQPFQLRDEDELRLAWQEFVARLNRTGQGVFLAVDEAQLVSPQLLEELRLLTELGDRGGVACRLMLLGTARLEERLASPRLALLEQRIAARSYLAPLNYLEVQHLVCTRLAQCGARQPQSWFEQNAWTALREITGGIPRLVCQVMDAVLEVWAAQAGSTQINESLIRAVWAEQQSIPLPQGTIASNAGKATIEFGPLKPVAIASPVQGTPDGAGACIPTWNGPRTLTDAQQSAEVGLKEAGTPLTFELPGSALKGLNHPEFSRAEVPPLVPLVGKLGGVSNPVAPFSMPEQSLLTAGDAEEELESQDPNLEFAAELSVPDDELDGWDLDAGEGSELLIEEPFRPAGRIGPISADWAEEEHESFTVAQSSELLPTSPEARSRTDVRAMDSAPTPAQPAVYQNPFEEDFEDVEEIIDACAALQRTTARQGSLGISLKHLGTQPWSRGEVAGSQSSLPLLVITDAEKPAAWATKAMEPVAAAPQTSSSEPVIKAAAVAVNAPAADSAASSSPFDIVIEVGPGVSWANLSTCTADQLGGSFNFVAPSSRGEHAQNSVAAGHFGNESTRGTQAIGEPEPLAELASALDANSNRAELKSFENFFSQLRGMREVS